MAGEEPRLVPLRERAQLTGENVDSLRAAAQDGRLPGARHDNRGRWLVPLPSEAAPRATQGDSEAVALLKAELAQGQAERDRLLAQVVQLTERAAGAEGENRALREALADLARRLDMATGELTEMRKPWWQRLMGRWND
jgi:hypothetical protein